MDPIYENLGALRDSCLELERITEQKDGEKERGQNVVPSLGLSDSRWPAWTTVICYFGSEWQNKGQTQVPSSLYQSS